MHTKARECQFSGICLINKIHYSLFIFLLLVRIEYFALSRFRVLLKLLLKIILS